MVLDGICSRSCVALQCDRLDQSFFQCSCAAPLVPPGIRSSKVDNACVLRAICLTDLRCKGIHCAFQPAVIGFVSNRLTGGMHVD